jgi:hypothetical protein
MTSAGAVPSSPQTLLNAEIEAATALSPGLTANLPGSLIEDMASTAAGAVIVQDQAYVDLVNSISPLTANASILYQLGAVYGVTQGQGSNTSVFVTFSSETPGFVIPAGFIVSDGTYQYVVQDGGIVATSGQSAALYCLATVAGTWAVPVGTVTTIITSVPSGITLTCTNLSTGTPGAAAQTLPAYQAQVIQAGQAVAQGMPTFLKTQLENVSGVQSRLVSVQQSGSNWTVLCGGGDPYEVANAIFTGLFDISNVIGSIFTASTITAATDAVITVPYYVGYTVGEVITVAGATPTAYNTTYTITGISYTYTGTGVNSVITTSTNSSAFGAYVSGGVVTPNPRNVVVSINNYPDTYSVTFINPPSQAVAMTLTWATISPNYVSPISVASAGIPAIVSYINSITVGQPISVFEIQDVFQNAVESLLDPTLISEMNVAITINGASVSPSSGGIMIFGDPQSFFETSSAAITITQA